MTHTEWITKWLETNEAYGACSRACDEMQLAFPELRKVRGHYLCLAWGKREHWWLVDPEGQIVDPTASQFPSGGRGPYIEWDESQSEPTGRCLNCGDYCYKGQSVCSEKCDIEFRAYLRTGML